MHIYKIRLLEQFLNDDNPKPMSVFYLNNREKLEYNNIKVLQKKLSGKNINAKARQSLVQKINNKFMNLIQPFFKENKIETSWGSALYGGEKLFIISGKVFSPFEKIKCLKNIQYKNLYLFNLSKDELICESSILSESRLSINDPVLKPINDLTMHLISELHQKNYKIIYTQFNGEEIYFAPVYSLGNLFNIIQYGLGKIGEENIKGLTRLTYIINKEIERKKIPKLKNTPVLDFTINALEETYEREFSKILTLSKLMAPKLKIVN